MQAMQDISDKQRLIHEPGRMDRGWCFCPWCILTVGVPTPGTFLLSFPVSDPETPCRAPGSAYVSTSLSARTGCRTAVPPFGGRRHASQRGEAPPQEQPRCQSHEARLSLLPSFILWFFPFSGLVVPCGLVICMFSLTPVGVLHKWRKSQMAL